MRPDHVPTVDIDRHPQPAAESHKNYLQVDVVAKDEPKTECGLKQDDHDHAHVPGKEEASEKKDARHECLDASGFTVQVYT